MLHLRCLSGFWLLFWTLKFYFGITLLLTHSLPMHPFSTPWKHQKTERFSDVFRGLRKGALGTNGLMQISLRGFRTDGRRFSKAASSSVTQIWPCGCEITNKKSLILRKIIVLFNPRLLKGNQECWCISFKAYSKLLEVFP